MSNSEFDAYIAAEGYHAISRVAEMEDFLLRAAKRYHELHREIMSDDDDTISPTKMKAWSILSDQFTMSCSDLRVFFSETEDYYDQPREERRRLMAIADELVCSGNDAGKIERAEKLRKVS